MSERSRPPWKATAGTRAASPPPPAGPAAPPPADTSWREGVPVLGEHRGSFAKAESEVAYRWIAPAVAERAVLDVGAGAGEGLAILADSGAQAPVGTCTDRREVEIATRLHGERARFIEAEPRALPLADRSFDVVVCLGPLEQADDPGAILDQLRRVLAPGGLLAVSLPLSPPRDPIDGRPLTAQPTEAGWRDELAERFANVALWRRRSCFAAAVVPNAETDENGAGPASFDDVSWLGAEQAEDRALLAIASDAELPELGSPAALVGSRDVAAYRDTIAAWEQRARKAEADGAAKHWELVASREAQRRLRKRLYALEHTPLRKLFRVIRGKPARIGEGPPIRDPERPPEEWD